MRTKRWERWERPHCDRILAPSLPCVEAPLFFFFIGTSFLGHFMGKKSLAPPSSSLLETGPHASLGDQRLQLSHDLLRTLLLKKALGMSPGRPAPHTQVSQAPTTGPGEA